MSKTFYFKSNRERLEAMRCGAENAAELEREIGPQTIGNLIDRHSKRPESWAKPAKAAEVTP